MKVVVNPIGTINVRVNTQNPQVSYGTSTFLGAANETTQIQQALNEANIAITTANTALSQVNSKYSANGGILYGNMQISGNITTTNSNTYTLGTLSDPFQSVYVGPTALFVDGIEISNTSGQLTISNVPSVNVVGNLISTGTISGTFDGGLF